MFGSWPKSEISLFDEIAVDLISKLSGEWEYAPVRSSVTHD